MSIRGAGGLVTAITAVAQHYEVLWISCALGVQDEEWVAQMGTQMHTIDQMKIRLVVPEKSEYEAYYNVISNPLLWFVQHNLYDTPRQPMFDEALWKAWSDGYVAINRLLAQAVAESVADLKGNIIVMPQDYHLYLLPRFLREMVGDRVKLQSFLHIPFPGADAWRVLPLRMRRELMDAMLYADRLGFQTERDTRRFLQMCADTLPEVRVIKPWRRLAYKGREVGAAPYPISIDVEALEIRLASEEVQTYVGLFRDRYAERKLILRVDRVEPSKNILRGFQAYYNFLLAYPEYQGKVEMLALLVPSRIQVAEYRSYLNDIMMMVGEINATLGDGVWEPVRLLLGENYDRAIAALSLYDVLIVNPLADGMNLVAKEGAVLNQHDGVLILSEEAGAAEEFGETPLLISPYDVYATREAIRQALEMPSTQRHQHAQAMAAQVRENNIHHWFARQLADIRQA
jgi:trehalose 6-phosphate synthase